MRPTSRVLAPLKNAILAHRVLHADETPVAMLKPGTGKTHRAYLWAYGSMADQVKAAFKLSDAEMQAISTHCRRPGTLFARFATTEGVLAQVLKTTASPLEWAFTTNAADAPVRAALARKLGGTDDSYWQALTLLAKMLPAGTAKPMIAAIMAEKGEYETSEDSVSMDVANRLVARAYREGLLSTDGLAEGFHETVAA